MAVKISQLSASTNITLDDFFPIVDSGSMVTKRASAEQILQYVTSSNFNSLTVNLLTGTNVLSTNLTGTTAQFTTISGTNVLSTNLTGTTAQFTTISGTNVVSTNLTGSIARFTTISGTNVVSTNLTGSTITGSTALFTTISGANVLSTNLTGTTAQFTIITSSQQLIQGDLRVLGTASIGQLNTVNQTSLVIGDKYITILSGGVDHTGINGAGFLWGTSSGPGETTGALGEHAHVLYDASRDALEIFPGLYVTGSTTVFGISGTTAQFTTVTASNITGSRIDVDKIYVNNVEGGTFSGDASYLYNIPAGGTVEGAIQYKDGSSIEGADDLIYDSQNHILSGTTAEFTTLTSSNIFGTTAQFTTVTSSNVTGTLAKFTTVSASNLIVSGGNALFYETVAELGDNAYVLYNSSIDKLAAFPGLYVTGAITASTALSASNIGATRGVFSVVSASIVSASSYVGLPTSSGGTPGGTNQTIQFNSGSTFSGSTNFVWNYTNERLGVGSSNPACTLDMTGQPVIDGDNRVILQVSDTTSMAAGVGAGFTFAGKYNNAGGLAGFAGVKGIKENSTDGNLDTALVFMTRKNGVGSIAEKMRITSDGNVGIGTSTPSERLHISNTGSVYTLIENTTNSGYSSVEVKNDTGSYVQLVSVGTATAGIWFGGDTSPLNRANTVGFRTGGSESALLFAAQGNVPLHIGQNDTTRLLINASSASFNNNKLNYDFRVAGVSDDNVVFVKASSDRVGIGTSSPNAKLDVNGNTIISGNLTVTGIISGSSYLGVSGSGGSANPGGLNTQIQFNSGSTFSGSSQFVWDYTNNTLGIGTGSISTARINLLANNIENNNPFGDVRFVKQDGWLLYMNEAYSTGLNAAQHSPQFILQKSRGTPSSPTAVQNGDQIGGFFYRAYDGTTHQQRAGISAFVDGTVINNSDVPMRIRFFAGPTAGADTDERFAVARNEVVVNNYAQSVDFRVEGTTDQNLIFTSGSLNRVGIGTSSPNAKLDVNGNTVVTGTLTTVGSEGILFKTSLSSAGFSILDRSSVPGDQLVFQGNAGNYTLFNIATKNADVGSEKLGAIALWPVDISKTANSTQLQIQNNPMSGGVIFTQKFGTGTAKPISFQTEWDQSSTPTQLVLATNGRVGIGTTSPNAKLDVNGNTIITGTLNVSSTTTLAAVSGTTAQFTTLTIASLTGSGASANILVSGSLSGMVAALTSSANTTYVLTAADSGKVIVLSSSSGMTASVGSGLPVGFTTTIVQNGTGSILISSGSGVIVRNRQGHTRTAGLYAVVTLIGTGSNGYIFAGDTTT